MNKKHEKKAEKLLRKLKRPASEKERRQAKRISVLQAVRVTTEDGRKSRFVSQDMSINGIRLLGNRDLVGQIITVEIPDGDEFMALSASVLWSLPVGDDLYANGAVFLD
ncbi:MAG: hypothetical protein KatS3mg105_4561 [Gemmatales bacterium]|nr:MAG: hypothetical protein KatS3mg105_4561 [Gemmatales bacterium]